MYKIYYYKSDWRKTRCCRRIIGRMLIALAFFAASCPLQAQSEYVNPDGKGDITFTPGLRIQARYLNTRESEGGNNDFLIQRLRLKGKGKAYDIAQYYFEVKIDNVGRFRSAPNAQVENAWLDFRIVPELAIRAGLYDFVFSRNALTSDSKLLLMDRSLIKDALTVLGFADNTIGLLVHGRPFKGHFEYSAGIFDNLQFEGIGGTEKQAEGVMQVGRAVVHLLDPAPSEGYADYQSSYLGKGKRLALGGNAGFLSKARIGSEVFDIVAWGGDLFFNYYAFTVEAEYDKYIQDLPEDVDVNGDNPDIIGDGWYAQGGYLFHPKLEVAARYQELDANKNISDDRLRWTSLGLNIYLRGHSVKIQTEYTFKKEQGSDVDNDLLQVQLQLDF